MKTAKLLLGLIVLTLFTGHAASAQVQLKTPIGQDWRWLYTSIEDEIKIIPWQQEGPDHSGAFHIFLANGDINCSTDCSDLSGKYKIYKNRISFSDFSESKVPCIDSQEAIFMEHLKSAKRYSISKNSIMTIYLSDNSGKMIFALSKPCKSLK